MATKEANHIPLKMVGMELNEFPEETINVGIVYTVTRKVNVRILHAGVIGTSR